MPAFLISAPTLFSLLVQDSGLECCCTLAQYFFLLTRSLPTYLPSKFSALKLRVKIDRIIIISRKQINTRFAPLVQLGCWNTEVLTSVWTLREKEEER